jgi:signal transduction histidine kinase
LSEGVLVGTLGIAIHQEYIDEEVRRVFFWLIAGAVLALALAFVASTYLTQILLKPLSALVKTARRVTENPDLFTPIDNPYKDEFSILINTFNHMLERLQNWQHYLRDWIDSMPTALFGVDREGKIVLANQVAMERFGGNISDKYFFSICPWLKQYEPLLQNVFQSKHYEMVDRLDRVVGYQKQYYRLVIYPLQHYGMGAVIRLDDITQEIQLMDSMIQHEKMMSLGGLAAGMAHELNNPLAGIVQHAQNIERRLSSGLPANQAAAEKVHLDFTSLHCYLEERNILQFVHGIRELGARASHIIQDMLQFSGKSQPDMKLVNLNDLIARVVKICQHDPKFKHVRVEVQADETLMPIASRAREIEQVIFNCMKNSAEAMLSEPARQKENHVVIKISGHDQTAIIEIIDNGPGIPEAVQKRIFEPFFTTKEVGEGTGLGLSIAYFIITTKHQGTMSVQSQEGQGTKISITLPM